MSPKPGFTLAEVLIALSVFVVGILSVITLTSQAEILSRTSGVRTKAALLAQEGIEAAVAAGYVELDVSTPFLDESSLNYLGSSFADFSRLVTIQYVDGNMQLTGSDKGMKLITATISWSGATGDTSSMEREFTTATIITDL